VDLLADARSSLVSLEEHGLPKCRKSSNGPKTACYLGIRAKSLIAADLWRFSSSPCAIEVSLRARGSRSPRQKGCAARSSVAGELRLVSQGKAVRTCGVICPETVSALSVSRESSTTGVNGSVQRSWPSLLRLTPSGPTIDVTFRSSTRLLRRDAHVVPRVGDLSDRSRRETPPPPSGTEPGRMASVKENMMTRAC
jgi:hypothetical protein